MKGKSVPRRPNKHAGFPYHITFLGNIYPSGAQFSIGSPPVIDYRDADLGYNMKIESDITNSVVQIDCYLSALVQDYAAQAWSRGAAAIRAIVDLVAFRLGSGVLVILNELVDTNGQKAPINHDNPVLRGICTSFGESVAFPAIVKLVVESPFLAMALNDLITAMMVPFLAEINCARTLEALRHLIAGPGTDPKVGWPVLHKTLNVNRSYLDLITSSSVNARHGNRVFTPASDVQEITIRTWTLMDRYFHYRLGGSVGLKIADFPILTA